MKLWILKRRGLGATTTTSFVEEDDGVDIVAIVERRVGGAKEAKERSKESFEVEVGVEYGLRQGE